MLKITRTLVPPTETTPETNQTVITIDGKIDSREQMSELFAVAIESADMTNIATLKEHYDKVDGNKTDTVVGYFLDFQQRLPGTHKTQFAGAATFTKNANVKVSLFQIQDSEYATTATKAKPEAATIDAKSLAAKLAAARTTASALAKKSTDNKVEAVSAK